MKMLDRREFIKRSSSWLGAISGVATTRFATEKNNPITTMNTNMNDENIFWATIRKEFTPTSEFINLENGFYSPMPVVIKDAYFKNIEQVNSLSSYYLRHQWSEAQLQLKKVVSHHINCSSEDFFFTRNTTESLNTVIMGIPLKKGDEVLISDQDYPSALAQWKYRASRDKLVLSILDIQNFTDEQIVEHYAKHITHRTKILHITHMIHATGQVLPVKQLCDLARQNNLETIVDGAHSFNHINTPIAEFKPDYYMCSFHKWTFNPLGSGLLYISPARLQALSPLFGEVNFPQNDIRKMERLGTLEPPVFLTIPTSLEFHNKIGGQRKEARLHFLKNYWANEISSLPNVRINTPLEFGKSAAIGNFTITDRRNSDVVRELFMRYKIHTNATDDFPVKGVRVTVNVHTSTDELDLLIEGIKNIAKGK